MATFADSSLLVTVSSAITADTDGAWVELFLSTSKSYKWMILSVVSPVSGAERAFFDIGTGAPGFQVADVISDQYAKWSGIGGTNVTQNLFSFPMQITLGTRLWIRVKDEISSVVDYEAVVTLSTIPLSGLAPDSSESFAAQSGPQAPQSPASFDVFGSWVTMFPALTKDRIWLCLAIHSFDGGVFTGRLDLGSGDPQTVDWGELHFHKRSASSYKSSGIVFNVPVNWAAGTKLSIRVKDSSSSIKTYQVGAVLF